MLTRMISTLVFSAALALCACGGDEMDDGGGDTGQVDEGGGGNGGGGGGGGGNGGGGGGGGNGPADCLATCDAAQDRDCTTIDDCDGFCTAGESLAAKGGCDFEYDNYESCATAQVDVCVISTICASQENMLSVCIGAYCLQNSDPECAEFQASL